MRFRRRRGISYILEVAMMTLVVVALATVVLTWGIGQVSNTRIALTGAVNDRINRMQETINVEDVQMLTSTTMRVYIRNTGAIQVVIDAVYANNVNTPISGTCPSGSFQAGAVSVASGAGSTTPVTVTLSTAEPSTSYVVTASAGWSASLSSYSATSTTVFTLTFSMDNPGPGTKTANWFTNYPATPGCSSASSSTKLNLAINAVGAVDVTVPASVSSCTGGPVCAGNTYTVTASTNRGTTVTGAFTV